MNSLQFMDKQLMDLSNSQKTHDFIDLMDPQGRIRSGKKEEIVSGFDIQPIRPPGLLQQLNIDPGNAGGARVWNSLESKTRGLPVGSASYSSLDSMETAKVLEKIHNANNADLLSEIDRTMRKHADNLLHALEGVSARVSQLESTTRHLEDLMDDLKFCAGNNHGSVDGKLRQLENILGEVESGVQAMRDKQDIMEGQLQVKKLQVSKGEQKLESCSALQTGFIQQAASSPQQAYSHQQPPPAIVQSPALPLINALPQASQQNLPMFQLVSQLPVNPIPSGPQREPYFLPPIQTQEAANQHNMLTPTKQLQPTVPAPPPLQHYQPPPPPQYSQPPAPPQQLPPPQLQPSPGRHPDESPYPPHNSYPQNLQHPPHPLTSQKLYAPPSHVYEQMSRGPNPRNPTAYGPSSTLNEPFPYNESPGQYSQPFPSSEHKLPTARALPHALPTATAVSGSGPAASGNRVPIDDVIERVTSMGFRRDHVRATVRKLTENGQPVDLNIVLDKLMNDGEGQHQRGWFGR